MNAIKAFLELVFCLAVGVLVLGAIGWAGLSGLLRH